MLAIQYRKYNVPVSSPQGLTSRIMLDLAIITFSAKNKLHLETYNSNILHQQNITTLRELYRNATHTQLTRGLLLGILCQPLLLQFLGLSFILQRGTSVKSELRY